MSEEYLLVRTLYIVMRHCVYEKYKRTQILSLFLFEINPKYVILENIYQILPNEYHYHHRLQGLGLLACSGSEIIFRNCESIWRVGRTPWTDYRPDERPLPAHSTTQHSKTRIHIHA